MVDARENREGVKEPSDEDEERKTEVTKMTRERERE